jgi:hypothetical protein
MRITDSMALQLLREPASGKSRLSANGILANIYNQLDIIFIE